MGKGMSDPAYRARRRAKMRPYNFELDQERHNQLRDIAVDRGISMAATVRQLISAAYLMQIKHQPHCVTGRACFMPHMHPQPPANSGPQDPPQ